MAASPAPMPALPRPRLQAPLAPLPLSLKIKNGSRSNSSPKRRYTAATCLQGFDQSGQEQSVSRSSLLSGKRGESYVCEDRPRYSLASGRPAASQRRRAAAKAR